MIGEPHREQPADFLVDHVDLVTRGRTLDLAMGSGRNALFLAELGCDVEGVDISADAIALALSTANSRGVVIRAVVGDLENDYRIARGAYDLIICFNYLQRSLFPAIKAGLRDGGMVVYETFIVDQAELFGKPRNHNFLLRHNELLDAFRDLRCLRYREGVIPRRGAVAGIVAQKA